MTREEIDVIHHQTYRAAQQWCEARLETKRAFECEEKARKVFDDTLNAFREALEKAK